jgi:tetratricopeptide (TPR) repeat protein
MVTDWLTVLLFLYFFKICWLGFIKYDKKSLLTSWYMNEHFSLVKQQKHDKACQYLQKASELCPGSVPIWCHLAYFHEVIIERSDLCDSYLAKAKALLDSSKQPADSDKAVLECYNGYIQQHRSNFQQGLEHMKKAYDLDPTSYRKSEYEKAIEMVKTNLSDSGEPE